MIFKKIVIIPVEKMKTLCGKLSRDQFFFLWAFGF